MIEKSFNVYLCTCAKLWTHTPYTNKHKMAVKIVTPNKSQKEQKAHKGHKIHNESGSKINSNSYQNSSSNNNITNNNSTIDNNNHNSPVYHQKDLFLPENRVNYYIYKPVRTLPVNAALHQKVINYFQLAYYKYQLATGLYMMNERERSMINFLVIASIALTLYHFVLF